MRLLLAEAVELVGGQTALEEGAGVGAGGGVALDEDLVAAARVVLAAEEVVVANLVEGGGRRVGGDVATDGDAGALRAVHENGRVPADPGAVAAFDVFVAGELRFVLRGDGVDVVGGGNHRHTQVEFLGALQQAEHDFPAAAVSLGRDERIQGFGPFGRFLRVRVRLIHGIRVLVVDSHTRPFSGGQIVPELGSRKPRGSGQRHEHHASLLILVEVRGRE